MSTFRALRVFNENDRITARVVDATLEELAAGEVASTTRTRSRERARAARSSASIRWSGA
jgi:hypothetical protein